MAESQAFCSGAECRERAPGGAKHQPPSEPGPRIGLLLCCPASAPWPLCSRLLLNYGLVDELNPYDKVQITSILGNNDPLFNLKR